MACNAKPAPLPSSVTLLSERVILFIAAAMLSAFCPLYFPIAANPLKDSTVTPAWIARSLSAAALSMLPMTMFLAQCTDMPMPSRPRALVAMPAASSIRLDMLCAICSTSANLRCTSAMSAMSLMLTAPACMVSDPFGRLAHVRQRLSAHHRRRLGGDRWRVVQ